MFFIGNLAIDAAVSESHTISVDVTQYPTELGANIADHARKKPLSLSIEGVVSDTPLGELLAQQRDEETAGILSPSQWVYTKLEELATQAAPVDITTTLRTYSDMKITGITVNRDARTGRALSFSLQATQIEIVSVERLTIKNKTGNKGFQGSKQRKLALQNKTIYGVQVGFTTLYVYGNGTPVDPKDVPKTAEAKPKVVEFKKLSQGTKIKHKPTLYESFQRPHWAQ